MDHAEKAVELFLSGYSCAQAVAIAFSDVVGMPEETLARVASPFGGGMARMREVCGAVSGMLIATGLLYGYETPDNNAAKQALYARAQAMAEAFRDENSSIICRDLLNNPPSDPNPTPRTEKFYKTRPCARMVYTAARILEEQLQNSPPEAVE